MSSVQESVSVADTVRNTFNFTVDKYPLSGPDNMRTPHYGLFRSDSGDCVGAAVRKGYEPHTVDDVCACVEAASGVFDGASTATCVFRDGHIVTVAPSREHRKAIFGTSDNIWPRLTIRASFDGRAFLSSLGYYRDACKNMAIIRSAGRSVTANIRHTANLRGRMDDLIIQFQALAAGWDGVVQTALEMEARQVNLAEFLRQVYPVAADATPATQKRSDDRIEKIVRRIIKERLTTGRPQLRLTDAVNVSAWEAFNGVQGYVQHDQARHGQPNPFTRAIIALDDAAVTRALDLALAV